MFCARNSCDESVADTSILRADIHHNADPVQKNAAIEQAGQDKEQEFADVSILLPVVKLQAGVHEHGLR